MRADPAAAGPDFVGFAGARAGRMSVRELSFVAMMAAVMCVVGPFSIPLPMSPVPISLTNLVIYFAAYLLGARAGTLSCAIYLLLGFAGLPVFAGFTGGASKLAGPTGGYLIGFIFLALICGVFAEKFRGVRLWYVVGMTLGTAVLYAFGTVWLAYQANLTFGAALFAGVIPFIPGNIAKIIIVAVICRPARRLMARAVTATGRSGSSRGTRRR
jgi:biotin transport system substrate-specific component